VPITATDVRTLHTIHETGIGVMNRADHHAGQEKAIALALLGGIIWRADPGSIEIKQYDGKLAVLWLTVNTRRYALAYGHDTAKIEIRDRTMVGHALHSFDNQTPVSDVETIFRGL
jgi:Integron cassette protein VCH_CASS1 chain